MGWKDGVMQVRTGEGMQVRQHDALWPFGVSSCQYAVQSAPSALLSPGHARGPQSGGLATHCSTHVPPQLRAAQRKAVWLPRVMKPGWHTEAAQVALSSKQPVGSKVVVVMAAGLPLALQQVEGIPG